MVDAALPMAPCDRMCYGRALENPLRRFFFPPAREIDLLGLVPGQAVVDFGAGVGYFEPEILRRIGPSDRLWVLDIDEENLASARKRVGGDVRTDFRVGSAAHAPHIPSGSVDRALLSLVICCMVDKEGALDEAWRVLRPGGRVLVTYPRRRRLVPRRRPSLRVVPERWAALQRRRPWAERPVPSSWAIQRHLLERSADPAASGI